MTKKLFICVAFFSLLFMGSIFAGESTKGSLKTEYCLETFVLADRYDHECAMNKDRWYTPQEAIQKCLFRVDISNCAKSLQIDAVINANCYVFASKWMNDAEASDLCRLNTYRCRF